MIKNCTCIKSIIGNLVIPCDEIVNTSIDSIDKKATYKIDYYFFSHSFISKYMLIINDDHCY